MDLCCPVPPTGFGRLQCGKQLHTASFTHAWPLPRCQYGKRPCIASSKPCMSTSQVGLSTMAGLKLVQEVSVHGQCQPRAAASWSGIVDRYCPSSEAPISRAKGDPGCRFLLSGRWVGLHLDSASACGICPPQVHHCASLSLDWKRRKRESSKRGCVEEKSEWWELVPVTGKKQFHGGSVVESSSFPLNILLCRDSEATCSHVSFGSEIDFFPLMSLPWLPTSYMHLSPTC